MLIVVKIGGRIINEIIPDAIISDIANLASSHKLVLIHGGGIIVTDIATKLGIPQKFVVSPKGFRSRYTDEETVKIYTMVMVGKLNTQIVAALESHGIPAVGLSGFDGLLIKAYRKKRLIILDERGRRRIIDGGYTGKISKINTNLLHILLNNGFVPVVAPVASSKEFKYLNVDGDRCAAYIAGFLKADKLILLTDVDGIVLNNKIISNLTMSNAKELLSKIGPGMSTKIFASIEALKMGVQEVIISSGFIEKPIITAIDHKHGTVIRSE